MAKRSSSRALLPASFALGAFVLAGCGGGGGSSPASSGGQIPVVAATAAPVQTPTPIPIASTAPGGTVLAGPNFGACNRCFGGWGPATLANALGFPVQSGYNGTGVTVATVIDSNLNPNDVAAYQAYFQTPQTGRTITTSLIDNASSAPGSDAGEAALDVETIAGLAPGANVALYVIPRLNTQFEIDAFEQIISDGKASIVNLSFSGCENSLASGVSTVFAQGAAHGIAFVAASGDAGSACNAGVNGTQSIYGAGVQYPASDPSVIAVGGTETTRPAFPLTNTIAWNDTQTLSGAQEASGGGVSTVFAIPTYQVGIRGLASSSFRNVPDVAMPASYDAEYLNGSWQITNGTSWGSPAFSAMLAQTYEYCRTSFSTPAALPYLVFGRAGYTAFLDVSAGNNQFSLGPSGGPSYTAHTGYDNVTGIGVPLGMTFAQTLCPNRVPAFAARASVQGAVVERGPERAVQLDLTSRFRGLVDLGRRDPAASTRIQLVLRPTVSLASDEQAVVAVLRAAGFMVTRTFANHLVVDATAPASVVEQAFSARLHAVDNGPGVPGYMPSGAVTIPASLAPYVAGLSLDDVPNARSHR